MIWWLFTRFSVNRRFWKRVDVAGPEECWLWRGPSGPDGSAVFDGRPAHLHAYELTRGPVPGSAQVRHRCGNPRCVNPDHLALQT